MEGRGDKYWELIPIGDMHVGNINCDLDLAQSVCDYVEAKPNALWIGMGDYADAISPGEKRYNINSIDPVYNTADKQYKKIQQMFEPIKDKCVGLLDGNHDTTHAHYHHHNYVDTMAYNLGTDYLTIDAHITLVFARGRAKSAVRMYAHHGWSSSRKAGGRVNNFNDMSDLFPMLDMYLMGHTHDRGPIQPRTQLEVNDAGQLVHKDMEFVFTGSYLKGYVDGTSSYIEAKAYKPTTLGAPIVYIEIDGRRDADLTYSRPKFSFSAIP